MREVLLTFTGPVRRPAGLAARSRLPLAAEVTLAGLLLGVGYAPEEIERLRAVVDGVPAPLDRPLAGGESVTVFVPVGGG